MPINLKETIKTKVQSIPTNLDMLHRTRRKKVMALARQRAAEIVVIKNLSEKEKESFYTDYNEFIKGKIIEEKLVDYKKFIAGSTVLKSDEVMVTKEEGGTVVQKKLHTIRCRDVTNCAVGLRVDSINAATIVIKNPHRKYCFKENKVRRFHPVFEPMDKIQVSLEGRFKTGTYSVMYPVFTGYITSVSQSFSGGFHTITLECEDKAKFLRITRAATKPSLNPLEAVGCRISAFGPPWWDEDANNVLQFVFGNVYCDFDPIEEVPGVREELEGARSTAVDAEISWDEYKKALPKYTSYYAGGGVYETLEYFLDKSSWPYTKGYRNRLLEKLETEIPTFLIRDAVILPYELQFNTNWNLYLSSWVNNMEVVGKVRDVIFYKFYANRRGQIIFEPLNTSLIHLKESKYAHLTKFYTIEDIDIMTCNISFSDMDLKTVGFGKGWYRMLGQSTTPDFIFGITYNPRLISKYGIRMYSPAPHPGLGETIEEYSLAGVNEVRQYIETVISRLNANVKTATVTILGRPEIDIGLSVYIPGENVIGYVAGVSHSFAFGTSFMTTLNLEYVRYPLYDLSGVATEEGFFDWLVNQGFTDVEYKLYSDNINDLIFKDKVWEIVSPILYGKAGFSEVFDSRESYLEYLDSVAEWDAKRTNQSNSVAFKNQELKSVFGQ